MAQPRFMLRLALLLLVPVMGSASPLLAQDAQNSASPLPPVRELETTLSRYYEEPFDVPRFLREWQNQLGAFFSRHMGFLAGLFAKHPEKIETVTGEKLDPRAQFIVVEGLRMADRHDQAVAAAARWGWSQDRIATIRPGFPLHRLRPDQPMTFDMFWGASYATGDASYVRPIYDYYASVAARPDIEVRDIVMFAVKGKSRPDNEVMAILRKYPPGILVQLGNAAEALLSLESNARQHKFVAAALDRYVKEQPAAPAAKGLNELRSALAGR
jgi:hypothetical protein